MYNVIIDYGTDYLKIAEKLCEDNSIVSIDSRRFFWLCC